MVTGAASADGGDDAFEFVSGGTDSGSLFDGGSTIVPCQEPGLSGSSGSALTTAVLAEQRPGKLFNTAIQHIKQRFAAIHGEGALYNDHRKVMVFYHEVIFKPSLVMDLSRPCDAKC